MITRGEGQARKSLWIETLKLTCGDTLIGGQARKSLWIETLVLKSGVTLLGWSGS